MNANPLRRVRERLDYRRERERYPNVTNSGVSHPHLIHPTARVMGANLSGPVVVGEHASLEGPLLLLGDITIGRYTTINGPNTDVFSRVHPVKIGAFSSIARSVTVQEYNHPLDRCATSYVLNRVFGDRDVREEVSKGPIAVGSDVWIGAQSVLLTGCRIGSGAIIGANAVVSGEIPPYAVAVGSPARVVKYRFDVALRERLEDLRWWDWPIERILNNRPLFEGILTARKIDEVL